MKPLVEHKVSATQEVFGIVVESLRTGYSSKSFRELHKAFWARPWAQSVYDALVGSLNSTEVYSLIFLDEMGHIFAQRRTIFPLLQEDWFACLGQLVEFKTLQPDLFYPTSVSYWIMALISIPIPFEFPDPYNFSSDAPKFISEFGIPLEYMGNFQRSPLRGVDILDCIDFPSNEILKGSLDL